MNILILSRNRNLYSTQRLVEAGIRRGHKTHVADVLNCFVDIRKSGTVIYGTNGQPLERYDAIIPRIGNSVTYYGCTMVRQFELQGAFVLNESLAISRSRDKLRTHQILSKKGIDMPITGFAHSPRNTDALIRMVGGPPLILKLLEGTQGKGVILAETKMAAESVIRAYRSMHSFFLVQEFIEEAKGTDLRCFVVGNQVVAAMMRKAAKGEFRSNLHLGGTAEKVQLTPDERHTAIAATQALGLHVAGVDLLRSKRGPLVLEVNSSPGLEGIERSTGIDVAARIMAHIEAHFKSPAKNN